MGINCGSCGTPLCHIDEACPNCLPKMAERPPTFACPSCAAKDARIRELEEDLGIAHRGWGRTQDGNRELRASLAASSAKVEAVIADTRKWYAEDIFGPVDETALKKTNLRYPGTVDRLSADMARRTCDLILSNYCDALKEGK